MSLFLRLLYTCLDNLYTIELVISRIAGLTIWSCYANFKWSLLISLEIDFSQSRTWKYLHIAWPSVVGLALPLVIPSRRREAPCEGTNSPRLFTPGETKALAKSKVHQWARAWVTVSGSVGGHPHWSQKYGGLSWIADTVWSNLKFAL
jgi:hypothetical protein